MTGVRCFLQLIVFLHLIALLMQIRCSRFPRRRAACCPTSPRQCNHTLSLTNQTLALFRRLASSFMMRVVGTQLVAWQRCFTSALAGYSFKGCFRACSFVTKARQVRSNPQNLRRIVPHSPWAQRLSVGCSAHESSASEKQQVPTIYNFSWLF